MCKLAFLSGLSGPAGALVGLLAVDIVPALNPLFMPFAAGAMIYVSGHELLLMAEKYGNMRLFGGGLLLSGVAYTGLVLITPTLVL